MITTTRRLAGAVFLVLSSTLSICGRSHAQVVNGGFESGNLKGWTDSGFYNPNGGPATGGPSYSTFLAAQAAGTTTADSNGVETAQTASFDGNGPAFSSAVYPTGGNYLAYVSNETAGGDQTLTGSSISQTFTLPKNVTSVTFDTMLLNNDQASDFPYFNDFGGVALTQGNTILNQFNVDLDPASSADQHIYANANAGGFLNSTTWLSESFDVSGLSGQQVTLTAYALNYGEDNSTETRLLLDTVQTGAAPVPELGTVYPMTLGLIVIGFILGIVRRKSHKSASILLVEQAADID